VTCTVTCTVSNNGLCAYSNGTTFSGVVHVNNGVAVSCSSASSPVSTTSNGGTCSNGGAINLDCVNTATAPYTVYQDRVSLINALNANGVAYADPGTFCNAVGTIGGTPDECIGAVGFSCSILFGGCSGTVRAVGQAVVICDQATLALQNQCFQNAACRGLIGTNTVCKTTAVVRSSSQRAIVTCPGCGGSKKGLLGLLGLLGLIPLCLCLSLLCCLLWVCCIRPKKTAGAVHFATIDAGPGPMVATGFAQSHMHVPVHTHEHMHAAPVMDHCHGTGIYA